jgi:tetratricopeptide (TPR) repeat protein
MLGSYEQAVTWCQRGIEANRNFPTSYFQLASALAHLDRLDKARSAVEAGLTLDAAYTVSRVRANWIAWSDEPTYVAGLELVFDGLRKAGAPE